MDTSGDPREQEQVLSAALRAQAAGNGTPEPRSSAPAGPPPTPGKHRLPVVRVLLFALVLGLLAGAIVGAFAAA